MCCESAEFVARRPVDPVSRGGAVQNRSAEASSCPDLTIRGLAGAHHASRKTPTSNRRHASRKTPTSKVECEVVDSPRRTRFEGRGSTQKRPKLQEGRRSAVFLARRPVKRGRLRSNGRVSKKKSGRSQILSRSNDPWTGRCQSRQSEDTDIESW